MAGRATTRLPPAPRRRAAPPLDLLASRPHVKVVFFGHTHVWQSTTHEGLHLVNLPAVGYAFRQGEPTGWVDCHLEANRMTLELRALDPAHPGHGKVAEYVWLPVRFDGEMAYVDWHDEWRVEDYD